MGKGLDELIESLLTEIAFSGSRGCRVTNLLSAIKAFYQEGQGVDAGSDVTPRGKGPEIEPDDLAVASKVWRWLVARPDVSVGVNRKFNHLSLEAVLVLPEDEDDQAPSDLGPTSSGVPAKPSRAGQSEPSRVSRNSGKGLENYRPRLHVSEERQWRILTGHGPDFKRVPTFEWKALVDIASVKEKGILQGDLVRLTGQDKRSLPTRTDALAKKGYIIKQPILLRGCRSSKIWLAQFAEEAREDADRDGLQYDKIDLSPATLTKDLDPVPFSQKWNGERLDYLAVAQAFIAVVKAWGLIRYCDVRAKLDVEERVPQMRALAKTSRWLTSIGSVTFVAARFSNSHRLFKDCVKFIREPTPAEWKIFRTTPKARLNIPSQRVGARGVASRARHEALSKSRGKSKSNAKRTSHEGDKVIPLLWTPQKPITNTVFEIIKRSGVGGSSNASIGRQTIGQAYRKYTAALNAALSFPNSQPQHLEHLSVTSNLTRLGKTMTYQFFATSEMASSSSSVPTGDKDQVQEADKNVTVPTEQSLNADSVVNKPRAFSQPIESRFASPTSSSLSSLSRAMPSIKIAQVRQQNSKRKRKQILDDGQEEQPAPKRRGRPPKPKAPEPPTTIAADEPHVNPQLDTSPSISSGALPVEAETNEVASSINVQESAEPPSRHHDTPEPPEPRPPGVYRGVREPLGPGQKRKGRPKRSCVVIFRSDRLKDPSFLGVAEATEDKSNEKLAETSKQDNAAADSVLTPPNSMDTNSAEIPAVQESAQAEESPIIQRRGPRRGKAKSHRCEKCGSSWRNSNGLEYHLNKSQTICNPNFVPPPRHPSPQPNLKQRDIRPLASSSSRRRQKAKGGGVDPPSIHRSTPSSIRVRAMRSLTGTISEGTPKPASTRGAILLQDLQTYDVIDREPLQSVQASPKIDGISTPDIVRRDSVPRQFKKKTGRLHQTQSQRDGEVGLANNSSHRITKELPREAEAREDPRSGVSAAKLGSTKSVGNTQKTPVSSNAAANDEHFLNTESKPQDKLLLPPLRGAFPDIAPRKQQSETSILASFKTCKPGNTSLGAQRRERTSKIIEYLLDHNSGVFPGNKSLYLVLVSLWNREYDDLAPPDRKMCQSTVSKMDKAGVLKQLHFFFLDGRGNMQDCAILFKVREDNDQLTDPSTDPKVVAIKEKMREMFPETYIPEAFSLSEMEVELFDALDSKHRGSQHENISSPRQKVDETRDVEVLQYPMPVMVDIPINATASKRHRESDDDQGGQTSKKLRIDAQGVEKIQSSRKYRKRPESEFWDSGKLALYLWNQKQNHVGKWDETSTHLQDPASGAWSWNPEANNQPSPGIESILSSVKSTRENDAYLRRQSSSRYKLHRARTDEFEDIGVDAAGGIGTPRKVQTIDRFVEPSTAASFAFEDFESEEDDDDSTMEEAQDLCAADDNTSTYSGDTAVRFSQVQSVRGTGHGSWPRLKTDFFESHAQGFTLVGSLPSSKWFQKENLPRSISDIPRTARAPALSSWADPLYGKFMRDLAKIERWEQSVEGSQILSHGSVAPEYIFLSLSSDKSKSNMEPITVEWPSKTQYTTENMPNEILNATQEDEDFGLSNTIRSKKVKDTTSRSQVKRTRYNRLLRDDWNTTSGLGVEYKTRLLTAIPRQPRGRSTHPRPINGETELIAAFVVFRTLIGGVDQTVDMGLVMKYFPEMSLSALKKFWPRIMRERKTYVDALTTKFQASFLEAYERGDIAPLDYNNLEDYDWGSLITWTARLETHQDVSLPTSLHALNEAYLLEDPVNEVVDWREIWFSQASVYNRIEAAAGESISIPIPNIRNDQAILSLARSWVRSLCCTSIKGADSPEKIRKKLLQLAHGDEASVNQLLGKVISKLRLEKLVVRAKGKIMGQSFRLHAQFVKQLDKLSRAEKFTQATAFKSQLDESFRANQEFLLPYASDDGTIMAIINLQTAGRIRADATDIPNIPFGFEPGNYEGRLFPKSYYHFQIRLVPTQTYMYDEDMPLLQEAKNMSPPTEGPQGEIPIWVDFFGKLNRPRWIEYLSMMVFALATKGPLTPASATVLLKPVIDEFEAKLIMDWLDALGLLQRVESENGATMAEWWWLVVGQLISVKGKDTR